MHCTLSLPEGQDLGHHCTLSDVQEGSGSGLGQIHSLSRVRVELEGISQLSHSPGQALCFHCSSASSWDLWVGPKSMRQSGPFSMVATFPHVPGRP